MLHLRLENINLSFRGLKVLQEVNIDIEQKSLHAIIGPNGAGKTSLLNCIVGLYKPQKGRILYEGKTDTVPYPPSKIAQMGIARVFQNIELFKHMTVLENLMLGRHNFLNYGAFAAGLFYGKAFKQELKHREVVEDIIDLLEIEGIRKKTVGSLPYGLQKRVELGRALAMEPKLLLLDEPVAGMNLEEKEDMVRFILEAKEELQCTAVLIEHDMRVVMDISDEVTVMNFGKVIAQGTPELIAGDKSVIEAYLGEEEVVS